MIGYWIKDNKEEQRIPEKKKANKTETLKKKEKKPTKTTSDFEKKEG